MKPPPIMIRAAGAAALLLAATPCSAQTTRFRIDDMALRDPHVFVTIFSCVDVTDTPVFEFSVNGELSAAIREDDDGDGLLEYSSLIAFQPLDRSLAQNPMAVGNADCTAPLESTECGAIIGSQLAGNAMLSTTGECLTAVPGTLNGYLPMVTTSDAPCFASTADTLVLDLGGIPLILQQAQVAARFNGSPATGLVNGLLRGFISETDADALLLPAAFPLVGGEPLSSLLPGGTGNCAAHDDRDVEQAESGWWFYLNFNATRLDEDGPAEPAIFANGFEE